MQWNLNCFVVPSAPPQFVLASPLTSRSLNITWSPPEPDAQNGDIITYYVLIEGREHSYNNSFELAGDVWQKTVDNLLPFHVYSFTVAAGTKVGLGRRSAPVLVEMPEDGEAYILETFL